MMSHFNFKSLAFYGVAIAAVLVLFKAVTAYGETNLKASTPIAGRYRLSYNQNLPNCLKPDALVLTLEQSGIYLNGSLLPTINNEQARVGKDKPSLTGLLSERQFSLSGTVPTSICNNSSPANSFRSAIIQSQLEGQNLQGEITLMGTSEPIEFTAVREEPLQPSERSISH